MTTITITLVGNLTGDPTRQTASQVENVVKSKRSERCWNHRPDLTRSSDLTREGLAMKATRVLPTRRHVNAAPHPELAEAVSSHAEQIADEVLATTTGQAAPADGWAADEELGLRVQVVKA